MIYKLEFSSHVISDDSPCFIIAEAGVNHNGNMDLAHKLINSAKEAGADCVKFQNFFAEDLVTPEAPKAEYQVKNMGKGGGQFEMLKALELSAEQQQELKNHCDEANILYLCTPYENKSVDLLCKIGVSGFKIASTDTTNVPFLRYVAQKGLPVILSTGMCSLGEVESAVDALQGYGLKDKFALLQCTAEYPAPFAEINLRGMLTLKQAFQCPVGFSDHTEGVGASPWAVTLGAKIVEKHFTLDKNLPGPDHRASIEPHEFREYVKTIRNVELALGNGIKAPSDRELINKSKMQKSLVARHNIKKGQVITLEDLACKRPNTGLAPIWIDKIINKKAGRDIACNEIISLEAVHFNL